jgi:hypothetical protein
LHVASAILDGCTEFLTLDGKIRKQRKFSTAIPLLRKVGVVVIRPSETGNLPNESTDRTTSSRSRNKHLPKKDQVELRPDGWERFRVAVSAAAKSGPKHRTAKQAKKVKH